MKFSDFTIGKIFMCDKRPWRVTDVGSRVVVAIAFKEDWMNGPPYALAEMVFDEEDQIGCSEEIKTEQLDVAQFGRVVHQRDV